MNTSLWKPNSQKKKDSLLKDFSKFVNFVFFNPDSGAQSCVCRFPDDPQSKQINVTVRCRTAQLPPSSPDRSLSGLPAMRMTIGPALFLGRRLELRGYDAVLHNPPSPAAPPSHNRSKTFYSSS